MSLILRMHRNFLFSNAVLVVGTNLVSSQISSVRHSLAIQTLKSRLMVNSVVILATPNRVKATYENDNIPKTNARAGEYVLTERIRNLARCIRLYA